MSAPAIVRLLGPTYVALPEGQVVSVPRGSSVLVVVVAPSAQEAEIERRIRGIEDGGF